MSCDRCDPDGDFRAYIKLFRLPDDENGDPQWAASAARPWKEFPEALIIATDPREVLTEAGWVLGAVAMEADWAGETT